MRSCTKAPTPYEFKCTLKNRSDCRWQCVRVCVCGLCAVFRQHLVVQGHVRERGKKKKVRKHCRTDRHATKTHAFPTHTHRDIFTHMHTCSPAHSAPTRWAKRAVAAQWSGTRQKGRGWMGWGNSGGGAEVHRGREAARWRGGCRLGAGRSVPVQPGVQACLSRPPTRLSFLLPHLFSLSLSLPFHRPLSLQLFLCVCTPTEVATGELYRQVTTVAFLPPTNMGGKKRGKYK